MTVNKKETPVPRALRGHRARKLWRELAPIMAEAGKFNAASAMVLMKICTNLAEIDPADCAASDYDAIRAMAKPIGIIL